MANEKILIIDRDDETANAMQLPLDAEGYRVFRAANGDTGLQMIQQVKPDLIILDALTDVTAGGNRVSLTLRNPTPGSEYMAYRNTPIIMLSAIHSGTALRTNPADDYLPDVPSIAKTAGPETLLEQVRQHLKTRP
ncbi:MAG: response regulator [Chloroflexi bacterium]|nr:response regulator [Chloroflexota bacterium]